MQCRAEQGNGLGEGKEVRSREGEAQGSNAMVIRALPRAGRGVQGSQVGHPGGHGADSQAWGLQL